MKRLSVDQKSKQKLLNKKALFVVNTSTYFSGLYEVAKFLKQNRKYNPIFYFSGDNLAYPTANKDISILNHEKILVIHKLKLPVSSNDSFLPAFTFILIKLLKLFSNRLYMTFLSYRNNLISVNNLIEKYKPKIIILAADNVNYDTAIFVKISHTKNIPVVVIPQWMAGPREPAEYLLHDSRYSTDRISNYLVGKLYPKWVYTHNSKQLIRLSVDQVLAKEWFGLAPSSPWVLHSGDADAIALESEFLYRYCKKEKLEENRLYLTGSIADDTLFEHLQNIEERRKKYNYKYSLNKKKPILLVAFPYDELDEAGRRAECEFKTYDKLVFFLLNNLKKVINYNLLISMHPSVPSEYKVQLRRKWKIKIIDENIINLIPLCDIFIASISSTIQWAIVCGKPVINYDVYRYRYHDYDSAKGVITIERKNDFLKYLRKVTQDNEFYNEMVNLQKSNMKDWGILDGKSGERILHLLEKLTK